MIPLFDLHCDTLSKAYRLGLSLDSQKLHISTKKSLEFSPYSQVMAIWTDDLLSDSDGFLQYKKIVEFSKKQGIFFSNKNGKALPDSSVLLSIEDARIIEGDLSRIELFCRDCVRFITPVWKNTNILGGAWNTDSGLSSYGKVAISEMLKSDIIIDVSHSSTQSFFEILELCSKLGKMPIASHSNSFSVCPHKRNLTNEQFSLLVSLDSIVGISLAPEHLSCSPIAYTDDIIRHIDAYLSLGGENNICLGCDFDGIEKMPFGYNGMSGLHILFDALCKRYGKDISVKIFRDNAAQFMYKYLH